MKRDIVLLNYYFSRKLPGPDIYIKEMHNMIKLKTILAEQPDGDANNNGYPDKTEKYQTLAQKGELPGLDPKLDSAYLNSLITRLQRDYEQVRYRRIDMSNFAQDIMNLYEKYKTKTSTDQGAANQEYANFRAEFKSMYPIATTNSQWQAISRSIASNIGNIYSLAKAVAIGDTSNIGYRVHARQKSNGIT